MHRIRLKSAAPCKLIDHDGLKAWSALQAANIRVYAVGGGKEEQAFQTFLAGRLKEASPANVRGHWQ